MMPENCTPQGSGTQGSGAQGSGAQGSGAQGSAGSGSSSRPQGWGQRPPVPLIPATPPVRVDLHSLRTAGTLVFSTIAYIEATLAALAEQPAALAMGLVKLPPIIQDLGALARSCIAAAANYEHAEERLIPAMETTLSQIAPFAAGVAVTVANLAGITDTPVNVQRVESLVGRAATNIQNLLTRLQAVGTIGDIRIEVSLSGDEVPGGRPGRHFNLYLPGTQSWSLLPRRSVFDLRSDLVSMAGSVASAAERATLEALKRAGFGADDTLTVIGYSQGALVGANLIEHGLAGKVLGLISIAAPIDAITLPAGVRVLNIQHSNDPVPMLDLTAVSDKPNWFNWTLSPAGIIGHSLESYQASISALGADKLAMLNQQLNGLLDQGRVEIQDWTAMRTH
ncbi:MAG: hypothetical protein ACKOWK_06510 [Micrococcales bacterium]